jgi:heavy metal efflux system protein
VLLGLSVGSIATAQTPISLKAAIDTALKNNLQVKNEQLKAQYQQLLISTATTLPKTMVLADAGQINSIYTDTKFGIAQTFSMPKVYARQKDLLQQEWKSSLIAVTVKEAQLKRQVAQLFYMILYVAQKKELLQNIDSLYAAFYKKAALRLAKGESNILEKASAETQLGQITMQLIQLQQDMEILQLQFQLLLNTTNVFVPENKMYKNELTAIGDTASLKNHAALQLIQQQQNIATATIQMEKSKLLPDWTLGYNNTSIKGTGADNKTYGAGQRFSSIQVGVGIPIFAKAQKAKVNSAKFFQQLAESNYSVGLQSLKTEYEVAIAQYRKHLATVQYFETSALKNAELITTTANQQLATGNINYLEWVQVINQATTVKNDYVEAVKNLNQSIIELNYFTNQ